MLNSICPGGCWGCPSGAGALRTWPIVLNTMTDREGVLLSPFYRRVYWDPERSREVPIVTWEAAELAFRLLPHRGWCLFIQGDQVLLSSLSVSGSEHHVNASKLGEPVSAVDVIKEGSPRCPLWQAGFSLLLRAPSPGTHPSPSLWTVRIQAATTIKPT